MINRHRSRSQLIANQLYYIVGSVRTISSLRNLAYFYQGSLMSVRGWHVRGPAFVTHAAPQCSFRLTSPPSHWRNIGFVSSTQAILTLTSFPGCFFSLVQRAGFRAAEVETGFVLSPSSLLSQQLFFPCRGNSWAMVVLICKLWLLGTTREDRSRDQHVFDLPFLKGYTKWKKKDIPQRKMEGIPVLN